MEDVGSTARIGLMAKSTNLGGWGTEESRRMATGSFPTDPSRRRVVLVLTQHDAERCAYEPEAGRILLDEETFVLQLPVRLEDNVAGALQNIIDARLARPGAMLVQSPFELDSYEDVVLATQRFALEKHLWFSNLCMYLGAKKVSVEQIDLRTRSGKSTLEIGAELVRGSGQATFEPGELEKFRARLNLRDEFAGGPPDLVAAEKLLRSKGLWSDATMRGFVELFRDGSNRLKSRRLTLSLSSEIKKNLNIVGRLKIPSFIELSAAYGCVVEEQCEYTITVSVGF